MDTIDGKFYFPDGDNGVGGGLLIFEQWERALRTIFIEFITEILETTSEPVVIFDVGSNFGTWTIPLAKCVGKRGRVYSFEVQLEMMNYLHLNIVMNGMDNIFPIHMALSNSSGILLVDKVEPSVGQNYGGQNLGMLSREKKSSSTYGVQKSTIDDLVSQGFVECPHFIKMDIELHELNVMIGASHVLRNCKPILLFEADCRWLLRSEITLLDNMGYSLAWVSRAGLEPPYSSVIEDFLETGQPFSRIYYMEGNNIIAVPREKAYLFERVQSGSIVKIDIEEKGFYVEDYGIVVCYKEFWCSQRVLENDPAQKCSGTKIEDYLVFYWKLFHSTSGSNIRQR